MTIDTDQFAAIVEQVNGNSDRLLVLSDAIASAFLTARLPVLDGLRPGRHAKPRERRHLRLIQGGPQRAPRGPRTGVPKPALKAVPDAVSGGLPGVLPGVFSEESWASPGATHRPG